METTRGIAAFAQTQPDDAAPSSWRRVVMVDDDPAVLRFGTAVLKGAGYDVLVAADGYQATELIAQQPPDFLITDWKMPNFDGIDLCRWVRQSRLPHYVYTIVVSGRTEVRHMVEAISAGADDFFSKPIRPGELLSRLQAGTRILERERRLLFLSRYDVLTEMLNRRSLFATLDEFWEHSSAEWPLACVMFDLDFFKQINDQYGHQVGDETIATIAALARQSLPDDAVAGRYGGEEFCVLLPGMSEVDACLWADGLRRRIAETAICCPQGLLSATASFGVAQRASATRRPQDFVDQADQALLAAKNAGRNCVLGFTHCRGT